MNLQDSFLNQVRKDNAEIRILLLNGAELTGHVKGFDNFTVIVASQGKQHLIYKHAIAQLIHGRPASRREEGGPSGEQTRPAGPPRNNASSGPGAARPVRSEALNTLDLARVVVPAGEAKG